MSRSSLGFPVVALLLGACGESPREGTVAPAVAPVEVVTFLRGTVELTGELAGSRDGALQIVATAPSLATPLVVKAPLAEAEESAAGTLLVPFALDSRSGMMAARPLTREDLPESLTLQVSYSPTGFVEAIRREHDLTAVVPLGDAPVRLRMDPGEAPASRPTSRPTSRPVVPADR